jgi:serine-type D-Ala-D-Ala carboxypeptidase/endopeptidase (penicillin-binding protein 4)
MRAPGKRRKNIPRAAGGARRYLARPPPAARSLRLRRAALLAILLSGLSASAPARAEDLVARLDAALGGRALRGARVGALVVSARDGRVIYAREPDSPLVPASNQKILTSLAALSAFGPTHRFTTEARADRVPDSSGAVGTLYVIGGGDPDLTAERWWRFAADLRARGVKRVDALVLDDSRFDRERWHPSWGAVSSRAYHAPVASLGASYGAFTAWLAPGAAQGDPVTVRIDPPVDYFAIDNRARTGPPRRGWRFSVDRVEQAGGERIVVSGQLPAGARPVPVQRSVSDPVRFAGAVLRAQLAAVGVEVRGETRVGLVPPQSVPIHVFPGSSVAEAVVPFLKWSLNVVGETLTKDLALQRGAQRGTFAGGAAAIRDELAGLGVPLAGTVIVDGSGLSYDNRTTPRALVAALRVAQERFGLAPELAAGLPIMGGDGTLRRRGAGARGLVRAKTGLLTQVVALSGYAVGPSGEARVFSLIVNGYRGNARSAMRALDAFTEELTRP